MRVGTVECVFRSARVHRPRCFVYLSVPIHATPRHTRSPRPRWIDRPARFRIAFGRRVPADLVCTRGLVRRPPAGRPLARRFADSDIEPPSSHCCLPEPRKTPAALGPGPSVSHAWRLPGVHTL